MISSGGGLDDAASSELDGRGVHEGERGSPPQFTKELRAAFPRAKVMTVYECFRGYSSDQDRKVVLAVEVRSAKDYHTHVVKLGRRTAVERDYTGWRKCVAKHHFPSRIFVSVAQKRLSNGRLAIIYHDARTLFGPDLASDTAVSFEKAASWAIRDDGPDRVSVERVIRQIYADLAAWFYITMRPEWHKAPLTKYVVYAGHSMDWGITERRSPLLKSFGNVLSN